VSRWYRCSCPPPGSPPVDVFCPGVYENCAADRCVGGDGGSVAPNVRILVVEDDAHFATAFARSIRASASQRNVRLELEVLGTTEQAMSAKFDAAVVDRRLSEPDSGVALVEQFRRSRARRHAPLILMSAGSLDDVLGQCAQLKVTPIRKLPPSMLVECVVEMASVVQSRPSTPSAEIEQFTRKLAAECGMPPALVEVLVLIALDHTYSDIAAVRATEVQTIRDQAKSIRLRLSTLIDVGRDIRASILAELLRDRDVYDAE